MEKLIQAEAECSALEHSSKPLAPDWRPSESADSRASEEGELRRPRILMFCPHEEDPV